MLKACDAWADMGQLQRSMYQFGSLYQQFEPKTSAARSIIQNWEWQNHHYDDKYCDWYSELKALTIN